MAEERLDQLLHRLEDERAQADQLYNAALTALDRALQQLPSLPDPPPAYDESQLAAVNRTWQLLPDGPPALGASLKGRLRAFVWRLVGPPLERQQAFNAALVDHLNRNVTAHAEAERALTTLIVMVGDHIRGVVNFQHHLVQYLQTITLYVDTKDRASAGQAQVLNAALSAMTDDWLKRWDSLEARERRFQARVAAMDDLRGAVALAQQTSLTLKREVERLLAPAASGGRGDEPRPEETHTAPQVDLDSYKYVGFEDAFRGSQDDIRRRLAEYVERFAGSTDVLDIGCGRGEFLDLLRQHGIGARGLDLNHEMVEVCRSRGFDVVEDDALSYLTKVPDASLGGVFAAQVVEHLDPSYLMRLIETAFHKIRPGGLIVLETINAACWNAFFESYIRDLTHVRPLHPDTLQYLLRVSGFQQVEIDFKSPLPEWSRLQAVGPVTADDPARMAALVDAFNENVAKLNSRMFTYMDYAAVGRR